MDRYNEWRNISLSEIESFDIENYYIFIHSVNFDDNYHDYMKSRIKKDTTTFSEIEANIDILENPFDLSKRSRISTSFDTSKQFRTAPHYGRVGFIVKFPVENIIYVGQGFNKTNKELKALPLLSPEDVINGKDYFNEVLVEGSTKYGKIVPIAIFVDYTGIYNEYSQMDINPFEREKTNAELIKLFEKSGKKLPIVDITRKGLMLSPEYFNQKHL